MNTLKRIDAFDVTFADSFARPALKVVEPFVHTDGRKGVKGQGEKRIYVGSDENYYDTFFELDKSPDFFIQKSDIEEYYADALKELKNPTYVYGPDEKERTRIFRDFKKKLESLDNDRLFFHFRKKYDDQKRYYLVLLSSPEDQDNYNYIRDIALPRVTRLLFIKFYDKTSRKTYIYVKPVIWKKSDVEKESAEFFKVDFDSGRGASKKNRGNDQVKYREAILKKYPFCVVTRVTDPDLLVACHIKGHKYCNKKEKYDVWNGLSMTPTIHALFDMGYLSFNELGQMILSGFLRNMDRKRLSLDKIVRVEINPKSLPYLKWHNEHTFKSVNVEEYSEESEELATN
jgi:hypothetical protein